MDFCDQRFGAGNARSVGDHIVIGTDSLSSEENLGAPNFGYTRRGDCEAVICWFVVVHPAGKVGILMVDLEDDGAIEVGQ